MYALCALGVAIAQIISNFFDTKFDAIWLSVAVSACEFLYVIFKFSPSLIPSDSKPFKNPLRQLSREPCSANWMIPKLYVLDELSSFLLPHPTINDIAITAVNPAAGFVDKEGKNVGNITGTSDLVLADKQLKLIRQMMPKAKNVGIFYSTNEANSKAGIEAYEKVADKYGFKIITQGITASADMPMAADSLLKKVDCITNLTDNLVVSNMQTYLQKANKLNIPVFGSEVEQVKLGCVACVGIDFVKLGKQTGKMAAKILKGEEKAKDMKFETFNNGDVIINTAAAKKINMTISKDVQKQAKQTFDKISAPEK